MLWFEQWMEWWRWLIPSWHVVQKSAKDQILRVDIPGQHVSPRVRYGMTCWLIRKALVSLSCWMRGVGLAIPTRPQGASGAWGYSVIPNTGKPQQLQKGPESILSYPISGNLWQSKTYDPGLTFVKACSDLLASHDGSVIMLSRAWQHGGYLVTVRWWNHYSWVQDTNLYRVYNCHDSRAYGYKRYGILFWLDGYWMGLLLVRVWDFELTFVLYWTITFIFCWTIPLCLRWDIVLYWTKFPLWT
jgi:hypothetical protein